MHIASNSLRVLKNVAFYPKVLEINALFSMKTQQNFTEARPRSTFQWNNFGKFIRNRPSSNMLICFHRSRPYTWTWTVWKNMEYRYGFLTLPNSKVSQIKFDITPKNSSSRTIQMLPPGLRQWTGKVVLGFLDSLQKFETCRHLYQKVDWTNVGQSKQNLNLD